MRIGGESTGKKLQKRARAEKALLRLKQGVKTIKRPVFIVQNGDFYCAGSTKFFSGRFPGVTAARCFRVKLYAVYTAIIWDM